MQGSQISAHGMEASIFPLYIIIRNIIAFKSLLLVGLLLLLLLLLECVHKFLSTKPENKTFDVSVSEGGV